MSRNLEITNYPMQNIVRMYTVDSIWKTQGGWLLHIRHVKLKIWKQRMEVCNSRYSYICYGI